MNSIDRERLKPLVAPLALASYIAWLAVWSAVTGRLGAPGDGFGWQAEALLLVFLVAWLSCLLIEETETPYAFDAALAMLALSALGLVALGRSGTSPILLILVASMLANRFGPRGTALSVIALNALFALLLLTRWDMPPAHLFPTLAAFGAFQVFAVLVLRYAEQSSAMAGELQQVNAHLMATRALLAETARDQERLRLSRELHDVAGHKLTALKLNLSRLGNRPELSGDAELAVAERLAGELLGDLRAVVRQLRDHDGIDLSEGFRQLAEPFPRPRLETYIETGLRVPRTEQAEALLRLAQEGLTNAARHGQARRARLELRREDGELVLDFTDDGRVQWPIEPGNGLCGMRERIESLGGRLEIEPVPGGGLGLHARLPMEATS